MRKRRAMKGAEPVPEKREFDVLRLYGVGMYNEDGRPLTPAKQEEVRKALARTHVQAREFEKLGPAFDKMQEIAHGVPGTKAGASVVGTTIAEVHRLRKMLERKSIDWKTGMPIGASTSNRARVGRKRAEPAIDFESDQPTARTGFYSPPLMGDQPTGRRRNLDGMRQHEARNAIGELRWRQGDIPTLPVGGEPPRGPRAGRPVGVTPVPRRGSLREMLAGIAAAAEEEDEEHDLPPPAPAPRARNRRPASEHPDRVRARMSPRDRAMAELDEEEVPILGTPNDPIQPGDIVAFRDPEEHEDDPELGPLRNHRGYVTRRVGANAFVVYFRFHHRQYQIRASDLVRRATMTMREVRSIMAERTRRTGRGVGGG